MTYPTTGSTTPPTAAAVAAALAANQNVQRYGGNNTAASILNAYQTGDWSGVTDLTGKPFSDEQQAAAVASAQAALAPAYNAQQTEDTATTEAALEKNQEGLSDFEDDQATQFGKDKDALDQTASDNGVLFSGARLQKQNDLKNTYQTADQRAVRDAGESAANTTRDYQYNYGNDAARSLSSYYTNPTPSSYNPGVAHGAVTRGGLAAAYDPGAYNFQGTKPVAQQANIQTRAAGLLTNRANKLSLAGYATKL